MANFGTLCTRVRQNIIDLPETVTNRVPELVNQAIRELAGRHNFKCMEYKTAVLTTTLHTRKLADVPADFKEYRDSPYLITAMGHVFDLGIAADEKAAMREWGTMDGGEAEEELLDGEPRVIVQTEPVDDDNTTAWHVYPLPDGRSDYSDGEYRLVVPYWRFLPDLSSLGEANWFTTYAELWIEYQATSAGFFLDWDEERGTLWKQRAAEQFLNVKNLDKRQRLSQTDNIPVSLDVKAPKAWRGDLKRR